MSYNIIATSRFRKEIKRLSKKFHSLKADFADLIEQLEQNPLLGKHIGNDCYKIRLSISSKGKGKSGGARVITYVYIEKTTIFLISIYDKTEQETISDTELRKAINSITE